MVYTKIIPDCSKSTLQGIIRGHIDPVSVIHSNGCLSYNGLVYIGFDKHLRVNHGANEYAGGSASHQWNRELLELRKTKDGQI